MKSFVLAFLLSASYTSAALTGQPCSGSGYASDPSDCTVYYQCSNGAYVQQKCPSGLNFNKAGGYCDWPANAPCNAAPAPAPAPAPGPAPQPAPTTKQPAGSSTSCLITQAEFNSAAATKGGTPGSDYYQGFCNSLVKAGITTRREAILFLSHAVWETVGFKYTKEVYCQTNMQACANAYPNNAGGLPGKVYYGRGMLQLTWDYNYKAASQYLYGDDRLLQNPDIVGNDPDVGWKTAAYFWWANVHSRSQTFGSTLKAINGALECDGGSHQENRVLRFNHYKDILQRLGEAQPADSDGYCSAN